MSRRRRIRNTANTAWEVRGLPVVAPPPSSATVVAYGSTLGAAWDATLWDAGQPAGATFTQVADGGRITTAATSGAMTQVKGRRFLEGGKVSGWFTIPDLAPNGISVHVYATRGMGRTYMSVPHDGFFLELNGQTGVMKFLYGYGEYFQSFGQTTLTLAPGTKVNWSAKPGTGASVWLNAASEPGTPTFPTTDAQFPARAFGWVGYGIYNGNAAARSFTFSPVTYDPLTPPGRPALTDGTASPDLTKPHIPLSDVPGGTASIVFDEQFAGSSFSPSLWTDHDPYDGTVTSGAWGSGQVKGSTLFESPVTSQSLVVSGGVAQFKATLDPSIPATDGAPAGRRYRTAELSSNLKWSTGANATVAVECRWRVSSTRGLWPLFWLMGDGDNSTGNGWPINGEVDIFEGFNSYGLFCRPTFNVHYPRDWQSAPPGTWLNNAHVTYSPGTSATWAAGQAGMYDSWHTITLVRAPSYMNLYYDGVIKKTYTPNTTYTYDTGGVGIIYTESIPLPPRLFTASQHLRLSAAAGGRAAEGFDDDQLESGTIDVDYVRVWKYT